MNSTVDPRYAAELRRELVELASAPASSRPRRAALIGGGVVAALALGGTVAVAGLRPAGQVADRPLATSLIINGVGPARVVLPDAPDKAVYVRVELACFEGTRCATPGGSVEGADDGTVMIQRDALPLTDTVDPQNAQALAAVDPASGFDVGVDPGSRWRLYAVFTDTLNPSLASLASGRTLGIPGNDAPPDLVPAVSTQGRAGWVDYSLLTGRDQPELAEGTRQAPIPVYDEDGVTQIGVADVSRSYPQ